MAKVSAEERHKKQLEKMHAKDNSEKSEYVKEKSPKELTIEELEKKGYRAEYSSGVPMFNIKSQQEADEIKEALKEKGSFGFRYPRDVEII